MPSIIYFQEIPIGGHFEFRGRRYRKLALSLASDEDRNGTIFMSQTEVMPDPIAHNAPGTQSKRPPMGEPKTPAKGTNMNTCSPRFGVEAG